jgi:hypothetical protein
MLRMRKPCAATCIEKKVNARRDFLTRQDEQSEKGSSKASALSTKGSYERAVY